jgi:hypothetical protein
MMIRVQMTCLTSGMLQSYNTKFVSYNFYYNIYKVLMLKTNNH